MLVRQVRVNVNTKQACHIVRWKNTLPQTLLSFPGHIRATKYQAWRIYFKKSVETVMIRLNNQPQYPTQNYLNRELGLLAFNRRVLAQATDERMPLLERLRFLCIVSSNLDEFFEIRMAGIKEQIKANAQTLSYDGKTAQEAYRLVAAEAHAIVTDQYNHLNEVILPTLEEQGIRFLRRSKWNEAQREWIRT